MLDLTSLRVPRHVWVRLVVARARYTEPFGHEQLYHGLIHRHAWRIGPFGVVVLRMPR